MLGMNEKIRELERKAETTSTSRHRNEVVCFACCEPGHFARNSPLKQGGKQSSGPAEGQAVHVRPGVAAQESVVANEVNSPACVNDKVLSAISDSGIYVTGIVNLFFFLSFLKFI